jgi:folate-binding protein YgfZ
MGDLIDWNHIVSLRAELPAHLGDPRREFDAARSGAAVVPVTQFELLRFHGGDAKAFLQGQLTCDLDQVTPDRAQLGGYCTPQGRLLANFLLMPAQQGYLMYLPADVGSAVADRMRKFVMRSKVTIERDSGACVLGLAGPAAPALLQRELGTLPQSRLAIASGARGIAVRLPGEIFVIIAPSSEMSAVWTSFAQGAVPAGAECWRWLQIQAGMPWIVTATQDQFLPQMIGLDAIGGVSFDKGCYTGQEIVARMHYRGEVKRKLRRGRARAGVLPGDALFVDGQPCGMVLNAATAPDEGTLLLAVVSEQIAAQTVQIGGGEPVDLEGALFAT